jgi:hypothetical protein
VLDGLGTDTPARETIEGFAIHILKAELLREERLADLVGGSSGAR